MSEPDFLEVDQPIPGQNYVCLSFVSPEKVLPRKEVFFNQRFTRYMLERYIEQSTHDDKIKSIFRDGVTPNDLDTIPFKEWYEDFIYKHEEKLTKEFSEANDFQTSVRTLKVRGSYESRKEAEFRAKQIQKRDPKFHVFVGQVGYWLPWDPNPDLIQEQEYIDDKLNTLMKKYMEQRQYQDDVFTKETDQRKSKAMADAIVNRGEQPIVEKPADVSERIAEMRQYADEKDRMIASGDVTVPGSSILKNLTHPDLFLDAKTETKTKTKTETETETDAVGDATNFPDPWIQSRLTRHQDLDRNSQTMLNGDDKLSSAERELQRQNQLANIAKGFF